MEVGLLCILPELVDVATDQYFDVDSRRLPHSTRVACEGAYLMEIGADHVFLVDMAGRCARMCGAASRNITWHPHK